MPLLVDTFNVLHVTGVLPPDLAGLDPEGLADLLAESSFAREDIWLVCDGTAPPRRPVRPGIRLTWSGRGATADGLLIRLLEHSSAPRRIILVSSDREIRRAARRRGATVLHSDEFLRRLLADRRRTLPHRPERKPQTPLAAGDVRHWLAEFGLTPEITAIPSSPAPRSQAAPPPRVEPENASAPPPPEPNFNLDLDHLLAAPPPKRDGPRAPRRSRRDRR